VGIEFLWCQLLETLLGKVLSDVETKVTLRDVTFGFFLIAKILSGELKKPLKICGSQKLEDRVTVSINPFLANQIQIPSIT
jgi:hypothetical protein